MWKNNLVALEMLILDSPQVVYKFVENSGRYCHKNVMFPVFAREIHCVWIVEKLWENTEEKENIPYYL